MARSLINTIQRLAAAGTLSVCALSTASAGLFCDWCVEPMRPYTSPECQPNWGYHPTVWKQFPESQGQFGSGDYCPECNAGNVNSIPNWNAMNSAGAPVGNGAIIMTAPGQSIPGAGLQIPMATQPAPMAGARTYTAPPQAVPPGSESQTSPYAIPPMNMGPVNAPQLNQATPAATPQSSPGAPVPVEGAVPNGQPPMPLDPAPDNGAGSNPIPQAGFGLPTPVPMSQHSATSRAVNAMRAGFFGRQAPVQNINQPRRPLLNGRLRYGRHGGPSSTYQTPLNSQATPLVVNASGQPVSMPPQQMLMPQPQTQAGQVPVQGVTYSQTVPATQTTVPASGYRKWFRLPSFLSGAK